MVGRKLTLNGICREEPALPPVTETSRGKFRENENEERLGVSQKRKWEKMSIERRGHKRTILEKKTDYY